MTQITRIDSFEVMPIMTWLKTANTCENIHKKKIEPQVVHARPVLGPNSLERFPYP